MPSGQGHTSGQAAASRVECCQARESKDTEAMFSAKRTRKGNDIACIFVHAGAGYHSVQNEGVHLQACNE